MSLASYAAVYNESDNDNITNNIDRKKRYRNKTMKNKQPNPKVSAMMKQIYNEDDDIDSPMSEFTPLENTSENKMQYQPYDITNQTTESDNQPYNAMHQPYNDSHQSYNAMHQPYNDSQQSYNAMHQPYNAPRQSYHASYNQDELMRKVNYLIYMLESQKNERTDNVMEELVLYTFLGVFVIFVVDSFARVGKYVR